MPKQLINTTNRKFVLPNLYFVTDSKLIGNKSILDVVVDSVLGGVGIVQLREKNISTKDFCDIAIQLQKILKKLHVPLIINDRLDIALACNADGLHIGQNDLPYHLARKILGTKAIIGLSVETLEQVQNAEKLDVDYLGVSPIFSTATKTDITNIWGLSGLQKVREISHHKLVAIGGINNDNVQSVMRAGADSVAVVSYICSAKNPQLAARNIKQLI